MDDKSVPEEEVAAAMAVGANVVQHLSTVVAAEELLGRSKAGGGGGSGWMDG